MNHINISVLARIGVVVALVLLAYTFAAPNRDCYTMYEEGIGDVQRCDEPAGRFPDW